MSAADETLREAVERLAREWLGVSGRPSSYWRIGAELEALLDEHPATPTEERECRYPCDCGQFDEEHCACMDGHDPQPAEVAGEVVEEREARMTDAERDRLLHWLHGGTAGGIVSLWHYVEQILRDHDAALTAKAKAEAWKRGHTSCPCHSEPERHQHRNPYRADREIRGTETRGDA